MSSGVSGGFLLRRFLGSAISNATGYALGSAVSPALTPLVQDVENEAWRTHRAKPLPAAVAAQAAARGFMEDADAKAEGSLTGLQDWRMDHLRQLSQSAPPLETLLALRRRGAITPGDFTTGIEQLGYLPQWRGVLGALRNVIPSVTDMVRFAVREVYDPAKRAALDLDAEFPPAFADDAANVGLSPERAGQYWAAHWELPSYEQGANMMYRGAISQSDFDGLLKALDYAPVWRGPLQEISRAIPTLSDMIRFAVREVYSPAQRQSLGLDVDYPAPFTAQAAKHGLTEQDARDYWAAHWRLPSALQGYRMLWRGQISQAELSGLLKALDYPAVWRDRLQAIAYLVPGRIDLKRMLKHGILDRAQVKAGYQRLGYTPDDAEHLTQIAEAEVTTTTTANPWLTRARSRLYTVAHNEYIDRSLGDPEAGQLLGEIGVPAPERTRVIALWQSERDIQRLELTPAQIKKAYKKDIYDEATAMSELAERGMTTEDATTFLASG
ncbi:MAG TPA: hypothetical protein VNC18_17510 [Gemmatimonadaceae bacterium]|jgi:hypothetical protein|nr:hypothetical protein [Gemmatimonadaceae bacterium]